MTTDPLGAFTPATRDWFDASFADPTPAQALGWPAIAAGEHTLICAPTGSGKTLAAFLWCLDRLMSEAVPDDPLRRLRVIYVSPLKALVHDVNRNLRSPLAGIALAAQRFRIRVGDEVAPGTSRQARHLMVQATGLAPGAESRTPDRRRSQSRAR